jgi:hypothetical protein
VDYLCRGDLFRRLSSPSKVNQRQGNRGDLTKISTGTEGGRDILSAGDMTGRTKAMTFVKFLWLLAGLTVIGSLSAAHAQGYRDSGGYVTAPGGTYGTGGGTGVRTGQGPLSQPVPPATSLSNPQQNYYNGRTHGGPYYGGPAQTNPPQNPFGVGPR